MRAVDTNVLVRLLAGDDKSQETSARAFVKGGAWVPVVALVEAAWVLRSSYGMDSDDLATALEMLVDQQDVVLQDAATVRRALQLFRLRPSLGFTDCLILESCRAAGHLPLGTFDRKLGKLDGATAL